jgi:uncharacterized protein YjdB
VRYRVFQEAVGWAGWQENGAEAGNTTQGRRLEAIEVRLNKK